MHDLSADDNTARLKNQRRSLLSLVARSRDPAADLAWLAVTVLFVGERT